MPENQSQPRTGGYGNPNGEPKLSPQPDKPAPDGPSDTEAAHAPEEGSSVRDPRLPEQHVDQNFGSLEGHPQRDKRGDYGAQGMKGTDEGTAGAEFADRMDPDAVRTETDSEGKRNPH